MDNFENKNIDPAKYREELIKGKPGNVNGKEKNFSYEDKLEYRRRLMDGDNSLRGDKTGEGDPVNIDVRRNEYMESLKKGDPEKRQKLNYGREGEDVNSVANEYLKKLESERIRENIASLEIEISSLERLFHEVINTPDELNRSLYVTKREDLKNQIARVDSFYQKKGLNDLDKEKFQEVKKRYQENCPDPSLLKEKIA